MSRLGTPGDGYQPFVYFSVPEQALTGTGYHNIIYPPYMSHTRYNAITQCTQQNDNTYYKY